jgi:hypothetical protein
MACGTRSPAGKVLHESACDDVLALAFCGSAAGQGFTFGGAAATCFDHAYRMGLKGVVSKFDRCIVPIGAVEAG